MLAATMLSTRSNRRDAFFRRAAHDRSKVHDSSGKHHEGKSDPAVDVDRTWKFKKPDFPKGSTTVIIDCECAWNGQRDRRLILLTAKRIARGTRLDGVRTFCSWQETIGACYGRPMYEVPVILASFDSTALLGEALAVFSTSSLPTA